MAITAMIPQDLHLFECQGEHFVLNTHTMALVHLSKRAYTRLQSTEMATRDRAFQSLAAATHPRSPPIADQTDCVTSHEVEDGGRSISVCLIMTHDCNLHCSYCYDRVNRELNRMQSLDPGSVERLLDQWSEQYQKIGLWFFGGEPLLRYNEIVRIVEYAEKLRGRHRDLSVGFSITTNGTLLTASRARFLAERGFGMLMSCDGFDDASIRQRFPDTADPQRERERYAGIFQTAVDAFRSHPERLAVRSTVTSENIPFLCENFAAFRSLGLEKIYLAPAIEAERVFTMGDAELWKKAFSTLVVSLSRNNGVSDRSALLLVAELVAAIRERRSMTGECAVLRRDPDHAVCAIDVDGMIYPCQRLALLGSGAARVLEEAWLGRPTTRSFCSRCWAGTICSQGVCPYINRVCSGHAAIPHAPLCEVQRHLIELSCWALWYQNHNGTPSL